MNQKVENHHFTFHCYERQPNSDELRSTIRVEGIKMYAMRTD